MNQKTIYWSGVGIFCVIFLALTTWIYTCGDINMMKDVLGFNLIFAIGWYGFIYWVWFK